MTSKNTETTKADQDLTASNPAAKAEHSMAAAPPVAKAEYSTAAANPITEGVIWQQILFFFFPLLLSSFFQQLYNTADALIVGRTAGKEALSAVGGSSGSVLIIFIMFYVGFAGGASVPAARFFGAKNERDLQETIRLSLLISSVLGIVGTVICFGGARVILTAMHTPADILDLSVSYLRIVAPGLIPSALYNMEAAALRAMGDSRRPLAVLIFTCLTNIGLDLLLVAVLGMGAVGAGIATAVCHLLSALLALAFLRKKTSSLFGDIRSDIPSGASSAVSSDGSSDVSSVSSSAVSSVSSSAVSSGGSSAVSSDISQDVSQKKSSSGKHKKGLSQRLRTPDSLARLILRMGLPLGLAEVMYTFANVILMSVVNGFGTDTVAAYAAYGKIDAIFWMVVGSFGISITTFVGQNIGAGRWDRVMQSIRESTLMMFIVLGAVIAVLYAFAYPLQNLFCTDPDVVAIGTDMMHFLMPFYFLYIPIEILFSALRGMGDSIIPTLITFFGVCVLRSVWGLFIVPLHHTVNMVLLGFPVTWIVSTAAFIIYFRIYMRRRHPEAADF